MELYDINIPNENEWKENPQIIDGKLYKFNFKCPYCPKEVHTNFKKKRTCGSYECKKIRERQYQEKYHETDRYKENYEKYKDTYAVKRVKSKKKEEEENNSIYEKKAEPKIYSNRRCQVILQEGKVCGRKLPPGHRFMCRLCYIRLGSVYEDDGIL